MNLTGKYKITLMLPGGGRDCEITLCQNGETVTGKMTNPYDPAMLCPIYDGAASGSGLEFSADVGEVKYVFTGVADEAGLRLTFETFQTIVLQPGKRLTGEFGGLEGEYLVGVFSPGGVKENHFVLKKTENGLGGEMFGLPDPNAPAMPMIPGGGMPPMPGGMPMPKPRADGKMDYNEFTAGGGTADNFEVVTETAQGSQFVFRGCINGDNILLTMYVADKTEGLTAVRV